MKSIPRLADRFLLLALLLLPAACGAADTGTITPRELLKMLNDPQVLILDVRTPEEFSAGHVPGAVNIPHTEVTQQLEKLAGRENRPIVVYCKSGRRAAIALDVLAKAGFTRLLHLEGDMDGWRAGGFPLEK
jgi:phage shock protein E